MGFMDDVTGFTKGVGQKAKDNYDIVAMNGKIASQNKEIRSIYTQMGEKYYALHKDEPEEALKDFVETVQSLEAQVEACGAMLPPDSLFCVKCGAKVAGDGQ